VQTIHYGCEGDRNWSRTPVDLHACIAGAATRSLGATMLFLAGAIDNGNFQGGTERVVWLQSGMQLRIPRRLVPAVRNGSMRCASDQLEQRCEQSMKGTRLCSSLVIARRPVLAICTKRT
jgi:hypothetical protein